MNGKVLVTGGHGNLGSYITKELCKEGYEVYILTRKIDHEISGIQYKIIEADITDKDSLAKSLNFDIDFCIHAASYNEFFLENYAIKALEINTLGTRNLLEILKDKKIKNFIYFSTFHVYGSNKGNIDEDSALSPKNDYASTHLFAEYYIKQFGFTANIPFTILRLTNSYGTPTFIDTDKWYLVLNDLVKSACEKKKIVLNSNGKAKRDFIYMGDVAKIVNQLLQVKATNEIYNLSSNQTYEVIELAHKVQDVYFKRYNQRIDIQINEDDTTQYEELSVENKKLKSLINFKTHDMLENEIEKIFDILKEKD